LVTCEGGSGDGRRWMSRRAKGCRDWKFEVGTGEKNEKREYGSKMRDTGSFDFTSGPSCDTKLECENQWSDFLVLLFQFPLIALQRTVETLFLPSLPFYCLLFL